VAQEETAAPDGPQNNHKKWFSVCLRQSTNLRESAARPPPPDGPGTRMAPVYPPENPCKVATVGNSR